MKNIVKYLYEAGQLKRVPRSGWTMAGIEHGESVAEHSFRTAVLAYILAKLEKADVETALAMALFHDMPEARINDLHKVGQRYADWDRAEARACEEQTALLPEPLAAGLRRARRSFDARQTPEARIARDADYLECLLQAREYQAYQGYDLREWITNTRKALKTKSAQRIAAQCLKTDPRTWWRGLKKKLS